MTSVLAPATVTPLPPFVQQTGEASDRVKNTLATVHKIQQIPEQLKKQAHDWAQSELQSLLKVVRVLFVDNPASASSIKALAKKIAGDVKDIAGQDKSSIQAQVAFVSQSQSQTSITELSASESATLTTDGKGSFSLAIESQVQITQAQISSSSNVVGVQANDASQGSNYGDDANLIGQALAALQQLKHAINNHKNGLPSIISGQENDVKDSINQLVSTGVNTLLSAYSATA